MGGRRAPKQYANAGGAKTEERRISKHDDITWNSLSGVGEAGGLQTVRAVEAKQHFSDDILADLGESKGLRIRAGTGPHRFIGIWFVMVNDRVFVRSWSVKPRGWYRTFLEEPCGTVRIAGREIAIRVVKTRDKRIRDAIDRAYLAKYNTPGAIKYAKDLGNAKSRATTLELRPFAR